jgi:hypothetical protein
MIITIIAEPRSGGTNLANWFLSNKDFTILYEPITSSDKQWYKKGISPKLWSYPSPHILIKETYNVKANFSELIEISDKLIILYRENIIEQTQSWLNSTKTNNWDKHWVFNENIIKNTDELYFNQIKKGIKENYLDKDYFNISYEELYYKNGFQKVVDYLNLDSIKNENFPYGKKYRVDVDKRTNLI